MKFKSLIELLDHFKDEVDCVKYFEQIRWGGNPTCPRCGSEKPYVTTRGYKCSHKDCRKKFTVKVGTYLENSKLPMKTWFAAIYLITTSKKGISSLQLHRQLGITQKSAWFLMHRIREMLKDDEPKTLGKDNPVEVDETYIGGKEKNKHLRKKRSRKDLSVTNEGKPYVPKMTVVGIIEGGGKVVLKFIPAATAQNLVKTIDLHVPRGAKVYTDEHKGYSQLYNHYSHSTVQHSLHIYTNGDVHTNTIENFWSVLKRGIYGIYHFVSAKHIERYLNEFATRFNTRLDANDERFEMVLSKCNGRLKYLRLISGS